MLRTAVHMSNDDGGLLEEPPSWVRIGVLGSYRSGKEHFLATIGNMSAQQHRCATAIATDAHLDTHQGTATAPVSSVDTATAQGGPDDALVAFFQDASMTLVECGAHCAGGAHSQPTSAHLRIALPTAAPKASAATAGRRPPPEIDVEVVNYWTYVATTPLCPTADDTCVDGHRCDAGGIHEEGPRPTAATANAGRVVLPDVALVTCGAFLVVFDVTRSDTFEYSAAVLSQLKHVFRDVDGATSSMVGHVPAILGEKLVVAVVASTHNVDRAPRCVDSAACCALGTKWKVPIFELSLTPSDVTRQRKVLEKVMSRVLRVRSI